MTRPKRFDCVEFKRRSQEKIYRSIRNFTASEEVEYFRRQALSGPFADIWEKIRNSPVVKKHGSRGGMKASGRRRAG